MMFGHFVPSHHLNKLIKQVSGVLGAGAAFRMVLHSKNILARIGKPLIGSVVHIYEGRNCYGRIQLVGIYHIAMVLGRNIYSPRLQILHRMVSSPVSVFHLMGIPSHGKSHQLMPQADRKDRDIRVVQLPDLPDDRCAFLGIPRAVAEHDAVRLRRNDLLRGSLGGIDRHLTASFRKGAGNVGLGPKVQQRHP